MEDQVISQNFLKGSTLFSSMYLLAAFRLVAVDWRIHSNTDRFLLLTLKELISFLRYLLFLNVDVRIAI